MCLSVKIKDDPSSEEQQGKNLVDAAIAAKVECFLWSTLPSSRQISGGRFVSRIYEGMHVMGNPHNNYISRVGLDGQTDEPRR